jgi:hypothetical protein
MGEPTGVSLRKLGLMAVDGLRCPEGGSHHVLEPALQIAAAEGGGEPLCLKCREPVQLIAATRLE